MDALREQLLAGPRFADQDDICVGHRVFRGCTDGPVHDVGRVQDIVEPVPCLQPVFMELAADLSLQALDLRDIAEGDHHAGDLRLQHDRTQGYGDGEPGSGDLQDTSLHFLSGRKDCLKGLVQIGEHVFQGAVHKAPVPVHPADQMIADPDDPAAVDIEDPFP